jgi:hypothetical protein
MSCVLSRARPRRPRLRPPRSAQCSAGVRRRSTGAAAFAEALPWTIVRCLASGESVVRDVWHGLNVVKTRSCPQTSFTVSSNSPPRSGGTSEAELIGTALRRELPGAPPRTVEGDGATRPAARHDRCRRPLGPPARVRTAPLQLPGRSSPTLATPRRASRESAPAPGTCGRGVDPPQPRQRVSVASPRRSASSLGGHAGARRCSRPHPTQVAPMGRVARPGSSWLAPGSRRTRRRHVAIRCCD